MGVVGSRCKGKTRDRVSAPPMRPSNLLKIWSTIKKTKNLIRDRVLAGLLLKIQRMRVVNSFNWQVAYSKVVITRTSRTQEPVQVTRIIKISRLREAAMPAFLLLDNRLVEDRQLCINLRNPIFANRSILIK